LQQEEAPAIALPDGLREIWSSAGQAERGAQPTQAGKRGIYLGKDLKATENVSASPQFGAEQQPGSSR